jgi:mannose-6-phosphate isomerase-like protein (cupin superfamily)
MTMTTKAIMKSVGFIFMAFASFAYAADKLPTEVVHWTFAEVKNFENKINQDPKTSAQNPVLTIMNVTEKETVRRTSFGKSGEAEIHGNMTDVFCILTGEGEFVVGGEIENPRTTNPGEIRGPSIKGGTTKKVGVGDVIIVPPGTPHQIIIAPGQRMSFMVGKFAKEPVAAP